MTGSANTLFGAPPGGAAAATRLVPGRMVADCPGGPAHIMRQRFAKYLPILAIAIWAQLVAPLVPYLAAAAVASDPLAAAEICAQGGSGQHDQGGPTDAHHDCELQCCLTHLGTVVFDGPQAAAAEIVRPWGRVVWFDIAWRMPPRGASSHAQARAPPLFS